MHTQPGCCSSDFPGMLPKFSWCNFLSKCWSFSVVFFCSQSETLPSSLRWTLFSETLGILHCSMFLFCFNFEQGIDLTGSSCQWPVNQVRDSFRFQATFSWTSEENFRDSQLFLFLFLSFVQSILVHWQFIRACPVPSSLFFPLALSMHMCTFLKQLQNNSWYDCMFDCAKIHFVCCAFY